MLILCWVFLSYEGVVQSIEDFREEFYSIKTKKDLTVFLEKNTEMTEKNAIPYLSGAVLRKAEFAISPLKKWKYFVAGRNQLEKYILKTLIASKEDIYG